AAVAVVGPGRIGRQIALAFALGGRRVLLLDAKTRAPQEHRAGFAHARREIARDPALMTEEGAIEDGDAAPALDRAESRVGRAGGLGEGLCKVVVRCADSPGFIGPRMQALLMKEAVRLVEEGVATPEDVDRAFKAGMAFRYAQVGIFEFIDWGGVDILHRAS